MTPMLLTDADRVRLGRRAQMLAGMSVAYNAIEAIIAIAAGAAASSIALVGFGLDSIVEMSSALIILWQFRHPMPQVRERRALRLIALSFFALATYVARRRRSDPDLWIIELDIPEAERFAAETIC